MPTLSPLTNTGPPVSNIDVHCTTTIENRNSTGMHHPPYNNNNTTQTEVVVHFQIENRQRST